AQFLLFTELNRIVNTEVQVHRRWRAARADAFDDVRESGLRSSHRRNDGRATLYLEPFVVAIDRVRNQLVERRTRLHVEVAAQHKLERELIGAVELELMRTIIRQTSVGVIEQALKVEQRSDVRIRLTVVVTEQAFIVTSQAGVHVRRDHLPVIGEALGRGNFERAIETLCASEATRRTAAG